MGTPIHVILAIYRKDVAFLEVLESVLFVFLLKGKAAIFTSSILGQWYYGGPGKYCEVLWVLKFGNKFISEHLYRLWTN